MAGSAPTHRVLDIVELLARPGCEHLRFSDIVGELRATQATTHAILATLCERGWIHRDPATKTYSLGSALAAAGARAELACPALHATRVAAHRLHTETGFAASVLERIQDSLVVAAHFSNDDSTPALGPGDRIPYSPPFGVALAACDATEGRVAWLRRAAGDPDTVHRLETVLDQTRARGFDVDWTTPTLAQAAALVVTLQREGVPAGVADIMDRLLVECTAVGALSDDDPARTTQPVATVSAPVMTRAHGRAFILAVHPLRRQTRSQIQSLGRKVATAAAAISNPPARSATS